MPLGKRDDRCTWRLDEPTRDSGHRLPARMTGCGSSQALTNERISPRLDICSLMHFMCWPQWYLDSVSPAFCARTLHREVKHHCTLVCIFRPLKPRGSYSDDRSPCFPIIIRWGSRGAHQWWVGSDGRSATSTRMDPGGLRPSLGDGSSREMESSVITDKNYQAAEHGNEALPSGIASIDPVGGMRDERCTRPSSSANPRIDLRRSPVTGRVFERMLVSL